MTRSFGKAHRVRLSNDVFANSQKYIHRILLENLLYFPLVALGRQLCSESSLKSVSIGPWDLEEIQVLSLIQSKP